MGDPATLEASRLSIAFTTWEISEQRCSEDVQCRYGLLLSDLDGSSQQCCQYASHKIYNGLQIHFHQVSGIRFHGGRLSCESFSRQESGCCLCLDNADCHTECQSNEEMELHLGKQRENFVTFLH
ncbi:hypothetical protein CDAR_244151 [Caerostris darwini]|uniref:Uncharacterized protein n=1 Tax=Caerostris darwini TaxID=1538125 RepID=A0AAV4RDN9_9ARAC|nr:hypothetical protein CDAR_244151 [Caerostris darwini]